MVVDSIVGAKLLNKFWLIGLYAVQLLKCDWICCLIKVESVISWFWSLIFVKWTGGLWSSILFIACVGLVTRDSHLFSEAWLICCRRRREYSKWYAWYICFQILCACRSHIWIWSESSDVRKLRLHFAFELINKICELIWGK